MENKQWFIQRTESNYKEVNGLINKDISNCDDYWLGHAGIVYSNNTQVYSITYNSKNSLLNLGYTEITLQQFKEMFEKKEVGETDKISDLAEKFQQEAHEQALFVLKHKPSINYQDSINIYIYRKLAELTLNK